MDLCNFYAFCTSQNSSVGGLISSLIGPAFDIAGVLLIFYFIFAAFKFMTSGGDKEALASARAMITHAVIGFLALMLLFLVVQFIPQFLGLRGLTITQ